MTSELHGLIDWWTTAPKGELRRGRLVHAFVPHVDQIPLTLNTEGRAQPTEHSTALVKLEAMRVHQPAPPISQLPVAALPHQHGGNVYAVYRAKRRPALVLSIGGTTVEKAVRGSAAKWQHAPTITVAPYYGTESATTGGWPAAFVERINQAEYPQYILDTLPIGGGKKDSVLRLDHAQPIGRHQDSYEATEHCLTDAAMRLVDEWYLWLLTGQLEADGALDVARKLLVAQ